ncbi:hypothetical protein ACIBP6_14005 [Nonomuraea terrae]|uniref:hypothetical protein n=1 Tax=Nonomuraea terrae TaxID=2530383 RepID=UPI0037941967
MFFEPPPPGEQMAGPPPRARTGLPAWFAPPADEMGVVVQAGVVAARSTNVAVAVPAVRAYTSGCSIDVEILVRQAELSPDDAWELHMSVFPMAHVMSRGGDRLPDRLLRFGVRYADGTKATTVGMSWDLRPGQEPPPGPRLSWFPSAVAVRVNDEVHVHASALWLWPLPPEETFELAMEWPLGGIDLTFAPLDGSAIVAAARRVEPYWPG